MIWGENPLFSETSIYQQLFNIYMISATSIPLRPRQLLPAAREQMMRAADREEGDPQKNERKDIGGWGILLFLGPKRVFLMKIQTILMSNFTVRLANSGPGMILCLPRCALIFKPFSGDWKMVGIRKPNDFFQFFQCHPSREETHRSSEVQFGSRLYCF